jgi:hypothetical protein
MVSGVNDFLIVVKAASGTGYAVVDELLLVLELPPPIPLWVPDDEPPLVEEVLTAEPPPLVDDVCSTVLLAEDPDTAAVCPELLSWLLADVVASVEALDVVALTPLVLLDNN